DGGDTWRVATTPIPSGQPSAGIFSIAFRDARNGVIVGGDYKKEGEARDNVATTSDGGLTWNLVKGPRPGGFRSAVAYSLGAAMLVATGPSGSDCSLDGGASWAPVGGAGYHAISFARSGAGWAVGEGGRIAGIRTGNLKQNRKGTNRTFETPRTDSRYWDGATPMQRLKVRVKWLWSQKPAARAIWTIGVSDAASSWQAYSIRKCRT